MIRSKFVAALALSATLGVGAASAADLPAWPYAKAPPLPYAVYNWAGFYVGGHLGGSSSSEIWTNTANTTRFGDLGPQQGFSQRGTGVFGGGQIGYNWQASNYVFGLEGTISAMDNRGSLLNTVFGAKDDVFSWRTNWMATVTGRTGIAVNNNLFYVKGGYAGVNSRQWSMWSRHSSARARIRTGITDGRLVRAGNTELPRTGSLASNMTMRPSRPGPIKSAQLWACIALTRSHAMFSRRWPGSATSSMARWSQGTDLPRSCRRHESPGIVRGFFR